MNRYAAIWPIARGSLVRNRIRYAVMAMLLGLAVAAYLLYATFMIGANVEAGLAMEEHRLPADIVYLGRQALQPAVVEEWVRRGGVERVAPLRQTRYLTEYGSLRVFALPDESPVWAVAGVDGGGGGGGSGRGSGGAATSLARPDSGEVLVPAELYQRIVAAHDASGTDRPLMLTVLTPGAPASAARQWRVAGVHAAEDSILGGAAIILLADPGPLPNSMFIWTTGQGATNSLASLIEVDYLGPGRPVLYGPEDPTVIHTRSAEVLAEGILAQTYMPGFGIMTMVFIFSGIGLFTSSSLAFLDRRRDLAILKTIGLENRGVVSLFLIEQGVIAVAGLAFGLTVAGIAVARMATYIPASQGLTAGSIVKAVIAGLAIQGAGVVVPALAARIATVNQLLFDQPIPLYYRRVYQSEV